MQIIFLVCVFFFTVIKNLFKDFGNTKNKNIKNVLG